MDWLKRLLLRGRMGKEESYEVCDDVLAEPPEKAIIVYKENVRTKFLQQISNTVRNKKKTVFRKGKQKPVKGCDETLSTLDKDVEEKKVNRLKTNNLEFKTINKVNMGKAIIKWCGNEGKPDAGGLRRLLHAVIDYIPTEKDQSVLENAELDIYDVTFKRYIITSGNGKCKLYVSYDERDWPIVVHKHSHTFSVKKFVHSFGSKLNTFLEEWK